MYRIGLVGHTPEYTKDIPEAKSLVKNTIDLIRFQYGEELIFNIPGDTGVSEWAVDACAEFGAKYHLFLPFPPNEMEFLWQPEQYKKLILHFTTAWATTIVSQKYDKSTFSSVGFANYKRAIEQSQFIICFWNKMKQGMVFESIRYALGKNILVIDAMNELKMITSEDIL